MWRYYLDGRLLSPSKLVCFGFLWLVAGVSVVAEPSQTPRAIDLQFQDIEVRRAIYLLGELAQQDIVVSDAVSGSMSLSLKEVTWREALDLILHTQDLAQQHIGGVLTIAPTEQTTALQKAALQRQQDLEQLQPLATQLLQVSYAQAKTLAELLTKKGNRLLSKRGAVAVDERTNTLVVTDTPERLAWVQSTLDALDKPLRQVQIEARIAIVSSNSSEQLGFRWRLSGARSSADGTVTVRPKGAGGAQLAQVGRLRLIDPSPEQVVKRPDGLLALADGSRGQPAPVKVVSGVLEGSNVNAVGAMVTQMDLARQFEAQMKLMNAARTLDEGGDRLLRQG